MRPLRVLALAAVAATVVLAIGAGAGSATTTLCTTTEEPCPAGYTGEVQAELESGTEGILTAGSSMGEVKCKKSKVSGKVETATTPTGKIQTLTFEECSGGSVAVKKNGSLTLHHDLSNHGYLTYSGFEIDVTAGVTCTFGGETNTSFTLTGGKNKVHVTALLERINGGMLCPATGSYHATYLVKEPKEPVYVTTEV